MRQLSRDGSFPSPQRRVARQVLFDYSKDSSTPCPWCVHIQRASGVKWQLLDTFLSSDWWVDHRHEYKWMWYPDDDMVLQPGGLDAFLAITLRAGHFQLLQPSLCAGSKYYHPEYLHDPGVKVPIVHIHTVELQMPMGRVQWRAACALPSDWGWAPQNTARCKP